MADGRGHPTGPVIPGNPCCLGQRRGRLQPTGSRPNPGPRRFRSGALGGKRAEVRLGAASFGCAVTTRARGRAEPGARVTEGCAEGGQRRGPGTRADRDREGDVRTGNHASGRPARGRGLSSRPPSEAGFRFSFRGTGRGGAPRPRPAPKGLPSARAAADSGRDGGGRRGHAPLRGLRGLHPRHVLHRPVSAAGAGEGRTRKPGKEREGTWLQPRAASGTWGQSGNGSRGPGHQGEAGRLTRRPGS